MAPTNQNDDALNLLARLVAAAELTAEADAGAEPWNALCDAIDDAAEFLPPEMLDRARVEVLDEITESDRARRSHEDD